MRTHVILAVSLLLLASACKGPKLSGASGDVVASAAALDFGTAFIGYPKQLSFTLTNQGRASHHVVAGVGAPFELDPATFDLPGGGSARVAVTFAPTAVGAAAAKVSVAADEVHLEVALSGAGAQPLSCTPSAACRIASFDPDAGACHETVAPDQTACALSAPCLDGAFCSGGQCVGSPRSCTDGDACTEDACDPISGCLHFDVTPRCPDSADPCQVPFCDPQSGCGLTAAVDGTPCGAADCVTANVCLAGACKQVQVPDGFPCAPETPCQGQGTCHNQVCVQPAATTLQPAWTYSLPNHIFASNLVADADGNVYWTEQTYGAATTGYWLTSLTRDGFLRFRTPLSAAQGTVTLGRLVLVDGVAVVQAAASGGASGADPYLDAHRAFDGSPAWQHHLRDDVAAALGRSTTASESPLSGKRSTPGGQLVGLHGELLNVIDWGTANSAGWDDTVVIAVDLDGGGTRWTHAMRQTVDPRAVMDEDGQLYVTLAGDGGSRLESLSPEGVERWSRDLRGTVSAAYGGRLAIYLTASDGGSALVSCIDGGDLGGAQAAGVPQAMNTFDGRSGYALSALGSDGGPIYGDCNDQLGGAMGLYRWSFDPVALDYALPVGPLSDVGNFPPTLLANDTVLLLDEGYACSGSTSTGDLDQLREISSAGQVAFSCVLPDVPFGYFQSQAAGDERWVGLTFESLLDGGYAEHVIGFSLPGVKLARHGWITDHGNPGKALAPR